MPYVLIPSLTGSHVRLGRLHEGEVGIPLDDDALSCPGGQVRWADLPPAAGPRPVLVRHQGELDRLEGLAVLDMPSAGLALVGWEPAVLARFGPDRVRSLRPEHWMPPSLRAARADTVLSVEFTENGEPHRRWLSAAALRARIEAGAWGLSVHSLHECASGPVSLAGIRVPLRHAGRDGARVAVVDGGFGEHPDLPAGPAPTRFPYFDGIRSVETADDDATGHGAMVVSILGGSFAGWTEGAPPLSFGAAVHRQAVAMSTPFGQSVRSFDAGERERAPPRLAVEAVGLTPILEDAAAHGARISCLPFARRNLDGDPGYNQLCHDLDAFVDAHPEHVVIAAAGNDPRRPVDAPGIAKNAVTVGAAGWSGRSGTPEIQGRKPDLLAPGDAVPAARIGAAPAPRIAGDGGDYQAASGSSPATAWVAGLISDLCAAFPQLDAATVKAWLMLQASADTPAPALRSVRGGGWGDLHVIRPVQVASRPLPPAGDLLVATATGPLAVALAWTDRPGVPGFGGWRRRLLLVVRAGGQVHHLPLPGPLLRVEVPPGTEVRIEVLRIAPSAGSFPYALAVEGAAPLDGFTEI